MTTNTKAREYLRVSLDKSGESRSTSEQHIENEKSAIANGWQLGAPYTDNGRSASRYRTKEREAFGQLISDLEGDRFGADILILWESSRGSREVDEWITMIRLCEKRGVRIHVTVHGHTYDPTNVRDRRSLLEDAVDSEYESGKMSQRLRRAQAQRAQAGMPFGQVPYGYKRRYHEETRKLIAQEPYEPEAKVVRELYDRIIKGHSLRSIAKDFEQRGVRNDSGRPFSSTHLRDMATRHVYMGKRYHRPGTTAVRSTNPNVKGTLYDGQWEGLVSETTWYKVNRILTAPERKTSRPGRGVHLLSMIAKCDVCSGPLAATNRLERYGWQYQCHFKGCVRVSYDDLTEYAEAALLGFLSEADYAERLRANDGRNDAALEAIESEIAAMRAELDELWRDVERGDVSPKAATVAERGLTAKLADAERRKAELSTPSVLRGLISPGEDVVGRWKAAPMSTKREVARLLFAPERLGELRVTRSPKPGHRGPIEQRVRLAEPPLAA